MPSLLHWELPSLLHWELPSLLHWGLPRLLHWELPRLLRGLGLLDWGLLSRGLGEGRARLGEEAADEKEVEDVENEEEGNFLAVEEEGLVRVLGVTG